MHGAPRNAHAHGAPRNAHAENPDLKQKRGRFHRLSAPPVAARACSAGNRTKNTRPAEVAGGSKGKKRQSAEVEEEAERTQPHC